MISDYHELPLVLRAADVSGVLGISRSATYNLLRRRDFPVICIGRRKVVPRDALVEWISREVKKNC